MESARFPRARGHRVAVCTAAVVAGLGATLGVASHAAAQGRLVPRVKMTLAKSIPPSPRFIVLGICGVRVASNSAKCGGTIVKATDNARKSEPLLPLPPSFSLAAFLRLSEVEQIFAIADIERTARHLEPIAGLTSQLDSIAARSAATSSDPRANLPLSLAGGGFATYYGSNWAGGTADALGANYYWMYDDGPNSPNTQCRRSGEPGCWGHRENILADYDNTAYCPSGSKVSMVMGAAEVTGRVAYAPSITEIFMNDCGSLASMYFTWPDVQRLVFGH